MGALKRISNPYRRGCTVLLGVVLLHWLVGPSHAQTIRLNDKTLQRAVSSKRRQVAPPTRLPQSAVRAVSYQEPMSRPSTASQPDSGFLNRYPTPADVKRLRDSYSNRVANRLPHPNELRLTAPRLNRQEDPFGDRQKRPPVAQPTSQPPVIQPSTPNARPAPGAKQEDPFGDKQKRPPVKQEKPPVFDPNANSVRPGNVFPPEKPQGNQRDPQGNQPNKGEVDQPDPGRLPGEQEGRAPVLPPDANPVRPRQDPVRPPVNPSMESQDRDVTDGAQSQDDFPSGEPKVDDSMDYFNGRPLPERRRNSNVYRAPAAQGSMPVEPIQAPYIQPQPAYPETYYPETRYLERPYQVAPGHVEGAPHAPFVPAFEPIPGVSQTPSRTPPVTYPPQVVTTPPVVSSNPASSNMQPRNVGQPLDAQMHSYQSGCCSCAETDTGVFRSVVKRLLIEPSEAGSLNRGVCPGFYFGFQGGWNDIELENTTSGGGLSADTGSFFNFALGRINGRNLRTELELSIRDNDISGQFGPPGNLVVLPARTGNISSFSGMANAYWDFNNLGLGRIRPYVGGGVGFASLQVDLRDVTGASVLSPDGDRDSSFAYQWMAGVNVQATCNLDLFVEYRFFEADAFRLESNSVGQPSNSYDYQAEDIGIGLRWKF